MAKFVKNSSGTLVEDTSVGVSAGSADATKIPHLNGVGVLDPSIVNSKTSSAGAADSGKLPALDATGRLDASFLPVGIGADTQVIVASEALAAGAFVNIWNSSGAKARNADATVAGKHAMGFVLTAVASGGNATVYFEGTNTAVTGQTPGDVFLATTAGLATSTCPSASGNVAQSIGIATSPTTINFQYNRPITLL
ncbi:MAG: hypothetical protein JWO15_3698 [Sphingomonadales bacterium]|nr:hypothetical protein [Sphingomonadales bacterium]